jgi:hypothetical protein
LVFVLTMIDKILTNILSTSLFISSFTQPTPAAPKHVFTQVLPEENYVSHTVEKDDSISSIAFTYYEDEDYWKVIWKDNAWIQDPNVLEEGSLLRINTQKPAVSSKDEIAVLANALPTVQPQVQAMSVSMPTVAPITQAPAPAPKSGATAPKVLSEEAITYLGNCEAGMDPAKNTGNGYYGAFQFSYGTWKSMGTGYERADMAPLEVQKEAVQRLVARSSIYTQFPACARRMQSAGLI